MIKLQKPLNCPLTEEFIKEIYNGQIIKDMESYISKTMNSKHVYLVHTCTSALEIAALALDLKPGDEVILPSYTFISTASAFLKTGAKLIFVDVDSTMNIDLEAVESALTEKTKAVIPVHYGGLSCDMDRLISLSKTYNFFVVEDAAQSIGAYYKNKALGTIGHMGCISFHHTKNIQTGEGGLLLVNDDAFVIGVQDIIDNGSDRQAFFNGQVSAYTWQRMGGAYKMDAMRAGLLKIQWQSIKEVTEKRRALYAYYAQAFDFKIPEHCYYNGHLFYIILDSKVDDNFFVKTLEERGIEVLPHYQPLHESKMGQQHGTFVGADRYTKEAYKLYRIPLHQDLTMDEAKYVVKEIKKLL